MENSTLTRTSFPITSRTAFTKSIMALLSYVLCPIGSDNVMKDNSASFPTVLCSSRIFPFSVTSAIVFLYIFWYSSAIVSKVVPSAYSFSSPKIFIIGIFIPFPMCSLSHNLHITHICYSKSFNIPSSFYKI